MGRLGGTVHLLQLFRLELQASGCFKLILQNGPYRHSSTDDGLKHIIVELAANQNAFVASLFNYSIQGLHQQLLVLG